MTLDVIKDIFGGILSNSTIFGGVPVGGGIVILPGVGAPHQPHPPRGGTIVFVRDEIGHFDFSL